LVVSMRTPVGTGGHKHITDIIKLHLARQLDGDPSIQGT